MKKLVLQAGHVGKGGGAPEELANNKRIVDRLSFMMRERGFEVIQTDFYAYNDPKVTDQDHDLFLACHADMDYPDDGGSGFADFPEPSTDGATNESQRICAVINGVYFRESGIKYVSHSNANTRFYYMWKHLTPKTPCVLLEMGQSIDPHDKVLLGNTDLIASSIARALCQAFSIPYDLTPPEPETNCDKELEALKKLSENLANQVSDLSGRLAETEKANQSWQKRYESANKQLENANKSNQELIAEKNKYKGWYETALKKTIDKYTAWQLIKMGVSKLKVKK